MKKYRYTVAASAAAAIIGGSAIGIISGKPLAAAIATIPLAAFGALIGVPLDMQDALRDFGGHKDDELL